MPTPGCHSLASRSSDKFICLGLSGIPASFQSNGRPLSIAASIAGLLSTAGAIVSALAAFVDAPQSARDALQAIEEVRLALVAVQGLVARVAALPGQRRALVRLDHIAVTFANCVLTLSELESLVCVPSDTAGGGGGGVMHRLRWLWSEKKVMRLLPRIESQKNSLSLMVVVLTCQSQMEALESRDKLNAAVDQILQRDEAFATRLQGLEVDDRSIRFLDSSSTVESRRASTYTAFRTKHVHAAGPSAAQEATSDSEASMSDSALPLPSSRDFEIILDQSRVYTRSESNDSDRSFTSSTALSRAWSLLSLNDISVISVFRLPITLADIDVFGPGLIFGNLLESQANMVAAGQQQPSTSTAESPQVQDTGVPKDASSTETAPQISDEAEMQILQRQTAALDAMKIGRKDTQATKPLRSRTKVTLLAPGPFNLLRPLRNGPALADRGSNVLVDGKRVVAKIKATVVGDRSTEKTRTLVAYAINAFTGEYIPVVFNNYAITVMIHDEPYILTLFDTSGQEDYESLKPFAYADTDVFLVFCRIGMPNTYTNAEEMWIPGIMHHRPGAPFILVGIKFDNPGHGKLEKDEIGDNKAMGDAMAERLGAVKYVECDIVTQVGLRQVFAEAIFAALKSQERKQKLARRSWRPGFLKTLTETKEEARGN